MVFGRLVRQLEGGIALLLPILPFCFVLPEQICICTGTTASVAVAEWQQWFYGNFASWSYPLASLADFSYWVTVGMS